MTMRTLVPLLLCALAACWYQPEEIACETDANCPTGMYCDPENVHAATGLHACSSLATNLGDDDDSTPTVPPDVDLIVVVDNSQSMESAQNALGPALHPALDRLASLGASIRVGVTTTDIDSTGNGGQGSLRSLAPVGSGDTCAGEDAQIVDVADPDATLQIPGLIDAGSAGSGEEYGLYAAALALCQAMSDADWAALDSLPGDSPRKAICSFVPSDRRTCNRGALRDTASTAILILSDEGDASSTSETTPSPAELSTCEDEHGSDPLFGECDCRVAWWVDFFDSFDATIYAVGPSYQLAGAPTPWCDGGTRDVPGPCNTFNSPRCGVDFYQQGSCLTGGRWWPLESWADLSCSMSDFDVITGELASGLEEL